MTERIEPTWLANVDGWLADRLEELGVRATGPVGRPHVRPWSTVLRVPTSAGTLWLKAAHPDLAHEAAVVSIISRRRPDLVPELLATDLERGWLLMADGGERLREVVERERRLDRWLAVLPLYAELQLAMFDEADALVGAGAPDRRLSGLPAASVKLGLTEGQLARVRDWCARLAALGIPETIEHDDLHDGQVFVRDGRYLFFDWGDACVSHPFCSLAVTLEGNLRWGLDDVEGSVDIEPFLAAYLEPFERYAPRGDLQEAARAAIRLGWVVRALFYREQVVALGYPGRDDPVLLRLRLAFDS